MAVSCHGVCKFYKATKTPTSMKYENGQKRCTFCAIFIETTDSRCPCCNALLRTKPRKNKNR